MAVPVPVKRISKPARAVKYLLSADRKLQRLSLRKIADRASKAKPETRATRAKQTANDNDTARFPWAMGGRFIVVGVVCLLAAAALLGARQPAARLDDVGATGAQEPLASPEAARLTAAVETNTSTSVTPTRSTTAMTARPHTAPASIEKKPAAAPMKTTERAKAATPVAAAPEPTAAANDAAAVTVEGCLEFDKATYRLKNTSGLNAPAARSWRSGFLMKRSASVELIDERGTLKLTDHIGQRVATTGSLVNREMHARTLRVIAASCR
jgi:hypothetical protein